MPDRKEVVGTDVGSSLSLWVLIDPCRFWLVLLYLGFFPGVPALLTYGNFMPTTRQQTQEPSTDICTSSHNCEKPNAYKSPLFHITCHGSASPAEPWAMWCSLLPWPCLIKRKKMSFSLLREKIQEIAYFTDLQSYQQVNSSFLLLVLSPTK